MPDWQNDHMHYHASPTARQQEIMEELGDSPVEVKNKGLHWYQWIVYTIVVITCIAVLISIFDAYRAVSAIQEAVSHWGETL